MEHFKEPSHSENLNNLNETVGSIEIKPVAKSEQLEAENCIDIFDSAVKDEQCIEESYLQNTYNFAKEENPESTEIPDIKMELLIELFEDGKY